MRKTHNVKSSASFARGISFLPPEMREFVKPARVAHVWARGNILSDQDAFESLADSVRSEFKGAVPVFHKFRRTVAFIA
jgi:hypothetical protein